jgi:methylthioribose-1-phosphate isomerase
LTVGQHAGEYNLGIRVNWQDLMIEEEKFDTSDNKVVLTIIKHLIVQGAPALEHTQMH